MGSLEQACRTLCAERDVDPDDAVWMPLPGLSPSLARMSMLAGRRWMLFRDEAWAAMTAPYLAEVLPRSEGSA